MIDIVILSFLSPILIVKYNNNNNLKVIYMIVRRVFCMKKKTATRKKKKRKKHKYTDDDDDAIMSAFFFLFLYDSSCLVYIVLLLLLLLLQFSSVVLRLISIGLFCRTRENTEQLSILFSPLISQQYRHIIESPSTDNLSLVRFLFDRKKNASNASYRKIR